MVPDVGEGNPSAALAIFKSFERVGVPAMLAISRPTAWPWRVGQGLMSRNESMAHKYTNNGDSLRSGRAMLALGMINLAEMVIRHPEILLKGKNPWKTIIAVQELPLAAVSRQWLEQTFTNGRYLYVPDVQPKKSAREVMKKTGLRPLVWNKAGLDVCRKDGLSPLLVAPVLPLGLLADGQTVGDRSGKI